jgi:hypothetical protein
MLLSYFLNSEQKEKELSSKIGQGQDDGRKFAYKVPTFLPILSHSFQRAIYSAPQKTGARLLDGPTVAHRGRPV